MHTFQNGSNFKQVFSTFTWSLVLFQLSGQTWQFTKSINPTRGSPTIVLCRYLAQFSRKLTLCMQVEIILIALIWTTLHHQWSLIYSNMWFEVSLERWFAFDLIFLNRIRIPQASKEMSIGMSDHSHKIMSRSVNETNWWKGKEQFVDIFTSVIWESVPKVHPHRRVGSVVTAKSDR